MGSGKLKEALYEVRYVLAFMLLPKPSRNQIFWYRNVPATYLSMSLNLP